MRREVLLLLEQDGCVRALITVVSIKAFLSGETVNTYFFLIKTPFSAEKNLWNQGKSLGRVVVALTPIMRHKNVHPVLQNKTIR